MVSGFSELEALDSNHDGVLNASDSAWSQLKVWVDTTGNGNFQSGQLYSLDQLGITSINLNAIEVNQNNNGNTILDNSTFTFSNGTTGDIAGVDLAFNPKMVESQLDSQLNNLISAMATFSPQSAAQIQATLTSQVAVEPLLATSAH